MTKTDLVSALHEKHRHLSKGQIAHLLQDVLDEIASALSKGERVDFRRFGAFLTKERKARVGRAPRTGDAINIPSCRLPKFRPGSGLLALLNS